MAEKFLKHAQKTLDKEERSPMSLYYKSFLVRVWRDSDASPWRASVTHVQTKETQQFNNVQALFIYLIDQMT